ncbi:MAG TPA: acetyl-CoA acetyltransferase [Casimicrobiaceae bacterium]
MTEAANLAVADSGVAGVLRDLDTLRVINVLSWPSADPPTDLSRALGVSPRVTVYSHVGGNTPQWQVNEAAECIARGESKMTLIAGADCMYSLRKAQKQKLDLGWSPRGTPVPNAGDGRNGINEIEGRHGATIPTHIYPLFENALRAHYGRSLDEHRASLGDLCASFSSVAASNPFSWFPEAKSAAEITTVDATNRYIGFPYPKYMNAIMDVDQGAALLMMSVAEARRLKVPEDRWVYLWGCGDATDHWYITERVNYHSSPAIKAAGKRALDSAGITIGDVAQIDLYSCFPSAVQIGRDALGIAADDARVLTVTGGLPYFGGPGNNYVTHSIAAMVRRLREKRDDIGLVTGNGWYVTKHSVGIYSTRAPDRAFARRDPKLDQAAVDAEPRPEFVAEPDGDATVETSTVLFDRDGAPERGIIIGRLRADGRRFIANAPSERALLEAMTVVETVGLPGRVAPASDSEINTFKPA